MDGSQLPTTLAPVDSTSSGDLIGTYTRGTHIKPHTHTYAHKCIHAHVYTHIVHAHIIKINKQIKNKSFKKRRQVLFHALVLRKRLFSAGPGLREPTSTGTGGDT